MIGRNRCNICVGGFVRDEPDFCLAHGDMSWVYGSDRAHLSLSPGVPPKITVIGSRLLKAFSQRG